MLIRPHYHAAMLGGVVVATAIVLEAYAFRRAGRTYAWREAGASLAVALLQRLAGAASALSLVPLAAFVWTHRVATLSLPGPCQIVVSFVLVEFAYYWAHRASHAIGWMWATHSVHHSAEQLNFPAALRLGATGLISLEWLPFVPLVALGISPAVVGGLLAFDLAYQFFLHSELLPRLGPLEAVLNTSSSHRVHHARNDAYRDRNFGGVVIVFDRLFGTYVRESANEPPLYGLVGERRGTDPLRILCAGWARYAPFGGERPPSDAVSRSRSGNSRARGARAGV